jgi:DNA-binding response OmpR family regulator
MSSAIARPRSPARVVVAEDDAEMRRVVAESLRADGHSVLELGDGAQLLVRIARQYRVEDPAESIDLIVSDLRMPVMTGLAILKGLRDAHCTTPVILMTAFGDESTRRAVKELGAILVDKPFKMADLRATVNAMLTAA